MARQVKSYHGKDKGTGRFKKFIVWLTLCAFIGQPILAAAQTVADPQAPVQNRPSVESAPNGVPVVQITAPLAAGVSWNLQGESGDGFLTHIRISGLGPGSLIFIGRRTRNLF